MCQSQWTVGQYTYGSREDRTIEMQFVLTFAKIIGYAHTFDAESSDIELSIW